MKFIASSLIAGVCIGIAAMTYLLLGGLIGSIMFAFGLMAVVWHDLKLFTGKAQFAWGKQDKRMPRYSYNYGQIVAMLGLKLTEILLPLPGCATTPSHLKCFLKKNHYWPAWSTE